MPVFYPYMNYEIDFIYLDNEQDIFINVSAG